jgi:hypothetical protein
MHKTNNMFTEDVTREGLEKNTRKKQNAFNPWFALLDPLEILKEPPLLKIIAK